MRTTICDELDIEFPIFAFTHCRDVVAAVSKAGGFGVLGAVGFTPEQLEVELARKVAALCGSPYQALKHKEAGVDIVIGQGGEGGGHTGEVGSIVLWPQIAQAIAPTPLLAAGGIGTGQQIAAALAMGAQGVWAGSLWLTVEEADLPPAQKQQLLDATSRDTRCGAVRSRASRAASAHAPPVPGGRRAPHRPHRGGLGLTGPARPRPCLSIAGAHDDG